MDVFNLVAKLTLDSSEYDQGLSDAEDSTSSFGGILSALGSVAGGVGIAFTAVTTAVTAVGAATVGTGKAIWEATSGVAEYGDNIDKMSQKMGISAQAYQEWNAVMQHSGTSMESMKASMKTLANAVEKGNEAFERIGLTQEQLANMSQEQIFEATIAGLQNVEDTTERTYLAGQLLGRGATELGALLNTSAEETQAMRDRVRELGGVLSDEAVKSAAQFQDNLQDLQTAIDGVKRGILSELLPAFNGLMDGFTKLISGEEGADEAIVSGIDNMITGVGNIVDKAIDIGAEVFPRLVEGIAKRLPDFIRSLGNLLTTGIPELMNVLRESVIPTIMETLPEIMSNYIADLPKMIADTMDFYSEFFPLVVDLATQLITGFADSLEDSYGLIYSASTDLMPIIINAILQNLPELVDAAIKIITAVITGMISAIPSLVSAIIKIGVQVVATIIELIPTLLAAAVRLITEFITTIVLTAMKFLSGDYWKSMLDSIVNSFTSIDWKGIGTMLTQGIADGIKAGFTKVKDAVTGVANGIKDKFTDIFDIHSPSKLFKYYGEMMMRGLDVGMEDSMDAVTDNIDTLNDDIAKNMKGISADVDNKGIVNSIITALRDIAREFAPTVLIDGNLDGIVDVMIKANNKSIDSTGRGVLA